MKNSLSCRSKYFTINKLFFGLYPGGVPIHPGGVPFTPVANMSIPANNGA